jgi:hypothetical protein
MYKISYSNEESLDKSGYNSPPEGFAEIDEKQFVQNSRFFHYIPKYIEFRQVRIKEELKPEDAGKFLEIRMFWMDELGGCAMSDDYWAGKIRYFKFGCTHEHKKELSQKECQERGITHCGLCWHVEECENCKRISSYDSSG